MSKSTKITIQFNGKTMQALLLPNKNPVRSMENDMASLCEGGLYPSLRVLGEIPKYE